jgi:hypothetical protein
MTKNKYADEIQANLYKKFPSTHYLSNPVNVDHVLLWNTFFRNNLNRLATDYLKIKLHYYQAIILYLMGICQFVVIIACRAAAKSWLISLYACCRCITRPYTKIVLVSATKGQSKLIVTEKIKNELMNASPILRQEIQSIKDGQNEVIVYFRNKSTITVVPARESARGNRSQVAIREEFRQIEKNIDDSIISPFQIIRQAPYMLIEPYSSMKELQEEPADIYISSSWIDNGHWMWKIVDDTYKDMLNGKSSCLLAFDESITLKHNIRTMRQMRQEKKKQDSLTWRMEYLNERVKENTYAFFSIEMLTNNQRIKKPFYPRFLIDYKNKKRNNHIPERLDGEIRIISCDMAFIENKHNDNSIFSCLRLLPESITYIKTDNNSIEVKNGYRRVVSYLEAIQGGDTYKQALRIRQLYEDFDANYIVLDLRNAGISIYDILARVIYDDERDCEYSPLSCMNDESVSNRIKINGADPVIFVISASQKLNSEIASTMRSILEDKRIDFLINYNDAMEDILPNINDYVNSKNMDEQIIFEKPYLENQMLISEMTSLTYEKHPQTGAITLSEQGSNRKDRYTSVSYGNYFASLLEQDLLSEGSDKNLANFIKDMNQSSGSLGISNQSLVSNIFR